MTGQSDKTGRGWGVKPGRKIEAAKSGRLGRARIRVKNETGKVYFVPTGDKEVWVRRRWKKGHRPSV